MSSGASRNERPMHVLTITPFYPKAGNDSGGCFIAEPIRELVSIGLQSTVFAVEPFYRSPSKPALSPADANWFRYPAIPGHRGLSTAGVGLGFRLRRAVHALHAHSPIDLIHAHGALPCGHAALQLKRGFGIPYVVTVHGRDAFSKLQVGERFRERCAHISQSVYAGAERVIGVSRRVCDEIQAGMPATLLSAVVYNGVDSSLFAPADEEGTRLLTVGNLIRSKGHGLVMHALAKLKMEFPDLMWEVIGEGPEEKTLRQHAAELGIAHDVVFRGRQDRRTVAEACRRCTIFVLPSGYEGLGCVYLEAMSAAKVAIGCTGQGIEEVIRHRETGWLIPPGAQTELIEGLRTLLRDTDLRRRIGAAARDQIVRSFTLRHQAQRLLHIYRECAR